MIGKSKGSMFIVLIALSWLEKVRMISSANVEERFPFVSIDPSILAENKRQLNSYDANLQDAFYTLKKKADRACSNDTLYTIGTKAQLPPSNNRQDYLSLARYYWPNEKSTDGLPYKRRDGHPNPEINTVSDYQLFRALVRDVQSLGLAYYFLENNTYAAKAINQIKAWFIDNSTRMNPHLRYASYIRGEKLGRRQGIIDLNVLPDLFNVIPLLQESPQWTDEISYGLRGWFAEYMGWLDDSELGFLERTSHNNHATYFDVQYMAIALFLGRDDLASKIALNATSSRIDTQISPNGAQPHETLRATSWFYSIFNLNGLFHLAALSAKVGVDLYHYKGSKGQSIKRALDYLLPYSLNQSTWPYPNVGGFESTLQYVRTLQNAYVVYNDPRYLEASKEILDAYRPTYNITRLFQPFHLFTSLDTVHTASISYATPQAGLGQYLSLLSISTFTILMILSS